MEEEEIKRQYDEYLERMKKSHTAAGVSKFRNSDPISFAEFKKAIKNLPSDKTKTPGIPNHSLFVRGRDVRRERMEIIKNLQRRLHDSS